MPISFVKTSVRDGMHFTVSILSANEAFKTWGDTLEHGPTIYFYGPPSKEKLAYPDPLPSLQFDAKASNLGFEIVS